MTIQDLKVAMVLQMLAFLHLIRVGEGTDGPLGYNMLVKPGGMFDDMSKHPHVLVQVHTHNDQGQAVVIPSTAAGAYQIIWPTWQGLVKQYGFADFQSHTQDLAAVALIAECQAVQDVLEGRVQLAIAKCAKIWASMPGSLAGQRKVTLEAALQSFKDAGGKVSVA